MGELIGGQRRGAEFSSVQFSSFQSSVNAGVTRDTAETAVLHGYKWGRSGMAESGGRAPRQRGYE